MKKLLLKFGIIVVLLAVLALSFAIYIYFSKYMIKVRQFEISESLGLKVVFISDIHIGVGKTEAWVEKIVTEVNSQSPDIVVIGGDFIEGANSPIEKLEGLSEFSAKYGVYAVLGNHDYRMESGVVEEYVESLRITVLLNEEFVIETPKGSVTISGIEDMWKGEAYEKSMFNPTASYNILVSHNPAVLYDTDFVKAYDLVLSGHTHGGQARIPFVNFCPMWPFPDLERKYRTGEFEIADDTTLIISSGMGENVVSLRIFARPTIEVISI